MLSADERFFLPQQLHDQAKARGFVFRSYRSSDNKTRALVIEAPEGKTSSIPGVHDPDTARLTRIFMVQATEIEDVGERRRISVAVFDGEAYSQTLGRWKCVWWVRSPNPATYVNTFIGTAKQVGMGVSQGTGNPDNEAGMTFPGAAYPFGAVRLTPQTGQELRLWWIPPR